MASTRHVLARMGLHLKHIMQTSGAERDYERLRNEDPLPLRKAKITAALSPQELEIQGAYDDPNGSHIAIYCVSEAFEGLRSMKRQQLVYKAIWQEMQDGGPVHAVDGMKLLTPAEAEKES